MIVEDRYIREDLRMIPEEQFFNRKDEIANLVDRMLLLPERSGRACAFTGPRLAGSSEIVKRVFHRLFLEQERVLPFYYRFERPFFDSAGFARDYLATLIRQYIAFQNKDSSLLHPPFITFQTVEKLARNHSDPGLDRLFQEYEESLLDPDKESLVRLALHAPLILADASTGYACVILDHLHRIYQMEWTDCAPLNIIYPSAMGLGNVPHLITGLDSLLRNKFLSQEILAGQFQSIELDALDPDSSLEVFTGLCDNYKVQTDPEMIKSEIHRFHGIPFYMASVIRRAQEARVPLTTVAAVQELYVQEISRYDIASYYESLLNRSFVDPFSKRDAIRILTQPALLAGENLRIEEMARRVSLDTVRVREITDALILEGLLNGKYGVISGMKDPVLTDFLLAAQRAWLGKTGMNAVRREGRREVSEIPILTEMKNEGKSSDGQEKNKISFGLVLPMVTETELVAARALEQVAERVDFPEDEIGKIRMALIEACINSFEHSGSQDGKIYITFTLDMEKLTIVVEDKGVSFDPHKVPVPKREETVQSAARRGWGIELIKNMMDQVVFDDVPVGTRLRMVKYYSKNTTLKTKAV
jgi:anti-sigma regulatory factor (Ser/Thr protein kinase)